jgi:hypothetical protein
MVTHVRENQAFVVDRREHMQKKEDAVAIN